MITDSSSGLGRFLVLRSCVPVPGTRPIIKLEMSSTEFDPYHESSAGGGSGSREDPRSVLFRLIGQAVLVAMVEDWTAESLVLYRETSLEVSVWELPDDSITEGSALQRQLMQQLAGTDYPLDELSDIVKDFLALVVFGDKGSGGRDGLLSGGLGIWGRAG